MKPELNNWMGYLVAVEVDMQTKFANGYQYLAFVLIALAEKPSFSGLPCSAVSTTARLSADASMLCDNASMSDK